MCDGDLLYKAILREPKEDTPRLLYADYLEEDGQLERAEFIRIQVELFKYPKELHWLENMPVDQWKGAEDGGGIA